MNLTIQHNELPEKLELEDKWILSKLNTLAREVCENLDKYELGVAASKIYDFIWDSYCDWYIELAKPRLSETGDETGDGTLSHLGVQKVLLYVLTEVLTLLHPFMPFITEEIWQALPHESKGLRARSQGLEDGDQGSGIRDQGSGDEGNGSSIVPSALMVRRYTEYTEALSFPKEEADFESVMAAVRAVRARRAEMNVPLSKKPSLIIVTDKPDVFEQGRLYLGRLAYAGELTITDKNPDDLSGLVSIVTGDARLYMPLSELVDIAKERERIEKEIIKAKTDIERTEQKLQNEAFTSKAPEHVINTEREKLQKFRALLDNLNESLKDL